MASDLNRINRKLKSAMKRFIEHDDEGALKSIEKLTKQREEFMESYIKAIQP